MHCLTNLLYEGALDCVTIIGAADGGSLSALQSFDSDLKPLPEGIAELLEAVLDITGHEIGSAVVSSDFLRE